MFQAIIGKALIFDWLASPNELRGFLALPGNLPLRTAVHE
jgi:hypothetical protein